MTPATNAQADVLNQRISEDQAVNILNAVRNESDDPRYKTIVPPATRDNLNLVGNPIISGDYQYVQNSFLDTLLNKIVFTIVWTRIYQNRLAIFKSGANPLGGDIEELHTNPIDENDSVGCDDGLSLLTDDCTPDVEAAYHRLNRQKSLCTTISRVQLRQAFTSFEALGTFINAQIANLFSSNEIWEYRYTKQLFSSAYNEGKIVTKPIPFPTGDTNASTFLKTVQTDARLFLSPRTDYNAWNLISGRAPRTSFSNPGQIYLVVRSDVYISLGVDLLARLFNLEYAQADAYIIDVDDFPGAPNLLAVLCDIAYPIIRDTDREMTNFWNPKTRCWTYYYHVWQTYSVSPFANAVAYYQQDTPPAENNIVGSAVVDTATAG